jgi:hypothetical protein
MRSYYVLEVWRDVEPILHGPFATANERDERYEQLRAADPARRNGLYALSCTGTIELA